MTHTSEIDDIPPSQVDQVVQDFKDAGATDVTKTKQSNGNFTVIATFDDGVGGGIADSSGVAANPQAGSNPVHVPVDQPASPSAPVPASPGHMVTVDPPFSVTGRATMFGLNYDGSRDQSDNGIGFFRDHTTGRPYNTRDEGLVGCSLPREVMLSTFLSIDTWKTVGIDPIWARDGSNVQNYVTTNRPLITIDSGGKTASNVPLVDAGPTAGTGNAIDLTFAVAHQLGTKGAALATYEILVDARPVEIRGWNWKRRKVG
jgi:hypothetical protein